MHLLLTDRLTCPRCGPEFGLILRADRIEDRVVLEGFLGCPNCRDQYPVRDGVGDLRAQPRSTPPPAEPRLDLPSAPEVGGLLGIMRGPGQILLLGSLSAHAAVLADLIEEIEIVALTASLPGSAGEAGVSRILVRDRLPLYARVARGVALVEGEVACGLDEVARVVAPGGRLVVFGASPGAAAELEASGLEVLSREGDRVVAARA